MPPSCLPNSKRPGKQLTKPCPLQVLTGILRHYATVLLATTPKAQELRAIREQRSLAHGIQVRSNFHVLSRRSFNVRRDALTAAYESGAYLKAPENKGQAPPNPMTDPNAMEGMMGAMKGQMAMIIPNTMIMSWINAFFSGYVISTSRVWPCTAIQCLLCASSVLTIATTQ